MDNGFGEITDPDLNKSGFYRQPVRIMAKDEVVRRCGGGERDFSGAKKEPFFKGMVMTAAEIINEYKSGRRDFSGVSVPNSDFSGTDLRGIIFRKANLHFFLLQSYGPDKCGLKRRRPH